MIQLKIDAKLGELAEAAPPSERVKGGRGKKKTLVGVCPQGFESRKTRTVIAKAAGRGRTKKVPGTRREPNHSRETATVVAKAHGTNAKSVAAAEKLLAEHPERAREVKSGEKANSLVGTRPPS